MQREARPAIRRRRLRTSLASTRFRIANVSDPQSPSVVNDAPPTPLAGDGAGAQEVAVVAAGAETNVAGSSSRALNRLRWGILLAMLLTVLGVCAQPAYRWWHANRTDQYRQPCEEAFQRGAWAEVEAIARQWVAWDPQASEGWEMLANGLIKQSKIDEAAAALGNIDDDYPGALTLLSERGDMLFSELNRPYEAVENWRRMLRINDHADQARQRLIYFYAITMQRELMREEILRAMELQSEPPEAYAYLLLAYEVTFSDGLELTRKWLQTYPGDETLEVAAAVYRARFSSDQTVRIFGSSAVAAGDPTLVNELLDKYPQNLELLAFHLEKAVFEGDEERVKELLRMSPPSAELDCRFWRCRGWLFMAQDRFEDAAEALEQGIELNPFDWRSRLYLAGAYRQLKRMDDASLQSDISAEGKDLQQELFERPNARNEDVELLSRIYRYALETGPEIVSQALLRRIGP